jgi:hypothetical protein
MFVPFLILLASTPANDPGDVLMGLSPELDAFHLVRRHVETPGRFVEATFLRNDHARLRIAAGAHESAVEREEIMRGSEKLMMRRPPTEGPQRDELHSSYSGLPLGDLVYRHGTSGSPGLILTAGAGRVYVSVDFSYLVDVSSGRPRWHVGDTETDFALVEYLVRRVLGRSLALDRISRPELEAAATAGRATDNSGRVYVPIFAWAGERQGSPERQGATMVQFAHQGRTIQALTGANKISIDGSWVPLGDTVMEIAGEPYVLREALENALR